jgi:glycosyltransferase involved in cell wall biosynthesis
MSSYPHYAVTHIHLDAQPHLPALTYQGQGNYLVFWWKEIPLGHSFIEPTRSLTEETYRLSLLNAIKPTVEQYAAQTNTSINEWQTWLTAGDTARWSAWLDNLLTNWIPATIPAQVPVSVVICTRNRAATLRLCLESLAQMTCQPAEVLIVDNAPQDDSTEKVAAAFTNVRYVVEPTPGLSYARNTGVKQATYDIIAFTDDDVMVHPEWVYRVWETFQDKKVFAMTGLVIASELETEAQQIFEKHWSFNRGYLDVAYDQAYFKRVEAAGPPVWEMGAGANNAFRKQVFDKVGLFDERLGAGASGCSEDSEMWFRILVSGDTVQYNPRAVVHHTHRKQLSELKRQIYAYMRGFAAAALIQQDQHPAAGYSKQLWYMPKYYASLVKRGFPRFNFRSRTLWVEMKGIVSGIAFYYKHRKREPQLPA